MKQAGGRPRGYTLDQVREAVAALVGRGAQLAALTAAAVKSELCEAHGVTQGIDPRSLDDALAQVRAERAEAERRARLPGTLSPAFAGMNRSEIDPPRGRTSPGRSVPPAGALSPACAGIFRRGRFRRGADHPI